MNTSKRPLVIILVIIIALVIILITVNSKKNVVQPNTQNGESNSGGAAQNVTQTKQGEVEVSDVSITSDGKLTNVSAQVTNNSSINYSMVDISIVFYDANKVVISTAKGLIENLAPQDKKGFSSSITGDFSKSSTYEVKIEKAQ